MYAYLIDAAVGQSKRGAFADRIETRLAELGVGGRSHRLTILKSPEEIIAHEIELGISTLVVIGTDELLRRALSAVAETGVVLGYIPIEESDLARYCGVPVGLAACPVIANRIVRIFALAKVHAQYFLDSVVVANRQTTLRIDDAYDVTLSADAPYVTVCNLLCAKTGARSLPETPYLRVTAPDTIAQKKWFSTVTHPITSLPAREVTIRAKAPVDIMCGQKKLASTPASITIVPRALKMIVGKEREF
jgi:diacylglycerol kinase family enzyme